MLVSMHDLLITLPMSCQLMKDSGERIQDDMQLRTISPAKDLTCLSLDKGEGDRGSARHSSDFDIVTMTTLTRVKIVKPIINNELN